MKRFTDTKTAMKLSGEHAEFRPVKTTDSMPVEESTLDAIPNVMHVRYTQKI